MLNSIIEGLSPVQREAVEALQGPSMIVAGAGSGKTRVLTFKIANLLHHDVPAYRILALTFTNKASKEMTARIGHLVGAQKAGQLWMGTFHSVFAKILRFEAVHLGYTNNFTIYDTDDAKSLLRSIVKQLQLGKEAYPENELLHKISMAKNQLITARTYANHNDWMTRDRISKKGETQRIYELYEQKCRQANAMDFDDLLIKTNILFRDFPEVLEKYQKKFDYILVDEYQDTNYSQYVIVKTLSALNQNITVVGDDAQSIYAFRGAQIENILNFKKDYPQNQSFKLEQNYRSCQNIVNAASSIIANNKKQLEKNIFSLNQKGDKVQVRKVQMDTEEGFLVASEILERRQRLQLKFSDFAILYRTNMQSRIMEEALRKKNIPYKIYGGFSFYQRKEIKDLIAYFRLVVNPADNEALKRIINYPVRGIGTTTFEKIEQVANLSQMSLWEVLDRAGELRDLNSGTKEKIQKFVSLITEYIRLAEESDAYDVAKHIANHTGILKSLHSEQTPEAVSQYENIIELLNGIKDYSETIKKEEELTILPLGRYLENVALLTNQDNEKDEDREKVTLMTIHSAKGLEYKDVHIVGVEQDLFPSMMAKQSPAEIEEERRLFYVAITRAEQFLTISYSMNRMKYGKFTSTGPSMFIGELDDDFVEKPQSQYFGNGFGDREANHRTGTSANAKPLSNAQFKSNQKFKPLTPSKEPFVATTPSLLQSGMRVEHERFGIGKILQIEHNAGNLVATVFFEGEGQKQLLLKFAKLKVIE